MDKRDLVEQIDKYLRENARVARGACADASLEAREGASPSEKRDDSRVALENSQLARAQAGRAKRAEAGLEALERFRPAALAERAPIAIGAIVEIEDAETRAGRTFFLAPVGAGLSLTGPGGDGDITVVTPASPIGKAVLGRRVGDVIDVTIEGEVREWTIAFVC